ncbi:MAG: hypothetical protein ACRD47_01485 [Nitrososphaeraceae archaeon]
MARARGLKSEEEQSLKHLCVLLDKDSISLIIIDSIIVHFGAEYPGRSMLPERQQRLNGYLSALSRIARVYKVAVVITNQVLSLPSGTMSLGDTSQASGGNILSHNSTHRIGLNKSISGYIFAKIVKSPYHS